MVGTRSTQQSDEDVDHYAVLGLPSGEEGAKMTLKEIEKAYRNQSRIRHPDKRPDDPNATADFQRLKTSFEVLKDDAARRVFDARLRARRERILRDSAFNAKRRKLATDLEERERAAEEEDAAGLAKQAERWEKHVAARLQKELAEFQARKTKKPTAASNSRRGSPFSAKSSESTNPTQNNIIGAGFQNYEASILKKLQKVAATQSMCGVQAVSPDISSPFSAKSSESTNPTQNNIIGAGFLF
ncbi:uncharacterized protein LOC141812626 [Curcuma longa]|uniref:uncharacterized protein LOC141812626 n=1 Tax=Curcuma longa TaxID=136217 RepID=UPI003D9E5735